MYKYVLYKILLLKIDATHEDISKIDACTFNMIRKGERTETWKRGRGNSEKTVTSKENMNRIGVYSYNYKVTQWKMPVEETTNKIEKGDDDSVDESVFLKLRKYISEITVILWEPEFLPFNYVILSVNFSGLLIEPSINYDKLDALFWPIVHHCKLSEGEIPGYGKAKFPVYYQFYYDAQTMKPALSKADGELKDIKREHDKSKRFENELIAMQYVKKCNELKQNSLFNNFNFSRSSISLINVQDNFFILGTTGNANLSWHSVASIAPNSYSCSKLSGDLPDFDPKLIPLFFLPYVLVATFSILSRVYETGLKSIHAQVSTMRRDSSNKKPANLKLLFRSLRELNDTEFNVNMLQSANESFQGWFFRGGLSDKSIITSFDDSDIDAQGHDYRMRLHFDIERPYMCRLNGYFTGSIERIEPQIQKIKGDLKIIQEEAGFERQMQLQKNNSKLNKRMLILSVVTAISAIVVGADILTKWFNP